MNEEQTGMLLGLLAQLVNNTDRIANAMLPEPYFERPLAAYGPDFDWSSIGAQAIEDDRDGATQIMRSDLMYYRRRGNNEDFGAAVWFSRPTGGKPAEGEKAEYRVLIKFRDRKVKRLNDETRDGLDESKKHATQRPAAPPSQAPRQAPPAAPRPAAQAPKPQAPAATVTAPKPAADPAGLFNRPVQVSAPPAQAQAVTPEPAPVLDTLDPRDDATRVTIAAGLADVIRIIEAMNHGATVKDLAAAVTDANGPTVFYSMCKHWVIQAGDNERIRRACTDAAGRVNWRAAVIALKAVIKPL